jgi:HAD superfamily hydrolase (TIGR01509 family)
VIDAVVFDLDGVILDSEELWNEVREVLARERGGRWRERATTDMMGMSSTEWSRYMHEVVGLNEPPEEINREVVRRMLDRYAQRLPLIDGAVDAVKRMAARWPLGLASSSNRELIDRALEVSGLAPYFRATVSSEEVKRGKPAPDVYLEAARRLGVEPTRCAAIEDSASGIRSAHAAGMQVVAIPNRAFPPPDDVLELAMLVLESISELEPDRLLAATRDSSRPERSAARSRPAGRPARGR